jgi:hypothetical protein
MISGTVVCSSFKQELLNGLHNFGAQQFWMALYDATASLDATTTAYITAGEVTGVGYIAGGQLLTNAQVLLDPASRTAFATFADALWDNSVITARAALIYNLTAQNRAVAVLDFGVDRVSNNGPFHVVFPPVGPSTALIRIS